MIKHITLLLLILFVQTVRASNLPAGFSEQPVATGLNPVSITKGLNNIIYITEKSGTVRVVKDDILLPDPLLNIEVNDYNERGLISIALHPDFFNNGYYYAYYCPKNRNRNRVARFTATNNGVSTLPGSEVLIMELDSLVGGIHNGGFMKFGSDGKLYVAVGEGGVATNSKTLTNVLGKILRLNADGSIPTDNPFYTDAAVTGKNKAIYCYGLRNPFAIDFDASGQLYCTDVGGGAYEEVNKILPSKFYGWPDKEGNTGATTIGNYQDPEYFYPHSNGACAIIGCSFYNPVNKTFPTQYHGQMFFGDYCTNSIYTWDPVSKERSTYATGANRPLSYIFSDNGDMYYVERNGVAGGSENANTASYDGKLWKIRYSNSNELFINENPQNVSIVVGENALFRISTFSNVQPVTYQWYVNNQLIDNSNNDTLIITSASLTDNGSVYKCVVSNGVSSATSSGVILTVVQDTRPVPSITSPASGFTYKANDVLQITGAATDAEDGPLDGSSLSFWIDLHHGSHSHPALAPTEGTSLPITFTIPNNGETASNVFFRVYLKATDSQGYSTTTYKDIYPQLVEITVNSNVPDVKINYDGTYYTAGQTVLSVKNIMRSIEAPNVILTDTKSCYFSGWSNGETNNLLSFATPLTNLTLTANYNCDQATYSGNGLNGNYADIPSVTTINNTGVLQRIDPEVNFSWLYESPEPATVEAENFRVKWEGYINIPAAGNYTFFLNTYNNEVSSLSIENQTVINKAAVGGAESLTEQSGTITFASAGKKKITVTYQEYDLMAAIKLSWSSAAIAKQIVPQQNLYTTNTGSGSGNGLTAVYSGTMVTLNGIAPKYNQIDDQIDFNWAGGSPNTAQLGNDLYTIKWTGYIRPPMDGDYTFIGQGDDGFVLKIGNDTIINQWHNGVITNKRKTIHLSSRTFYPIEFNYFENTGDANVKLEWLSNSISKDVVPKKFLYTTLPSIAITSPASALCTGSTLLLSTEDIPDATYKWYKGTDLIINANQFSYSATSAGTYKVEIIYSSGVSIVSQAKVITENPIPSATITSSVTSFCEGGSLLLSANTETGLSYKWYKGGNPIANAINNTYSATSAGTYTVEVTNNNTCKTTSVPKIITTIAPSIWYADNDGDGKGDPATTTLACVKPPGYVAEAGDACPTDPVKTTPGNCGCNLTEASCVQTSILSNAGNTYITVAPTPFDHTTTLSLTNGGNIISVLIVNASGAIVYSQHMHTSEIELGSTLSPGLYNVIIESEKGSFSTKIVKSK